MGNKKVKKIILFASGSGTNVENIIKYFNDNIHVEIVGVFTNNPKAGVIDRVEQMKIPLNIFNKLELNDGELVKHICLLTPDLIVLAGFLHGGKGMYGDRVHQSVKKAGDKETGISIHYVNEHYDDGSIIFQAKVRVLEQDSIRKIALKVQRLEHKYYPEIIQKLLFP